MLTKPGKGIDEHSENINKELGNLKRISVGKDFIYSRGISTKYSVYPEHCWVWLNLLHSSWPDKQSMSVFHKWAKIDNHSSHYMIVLKCPGEDVSILLCVVFYCEARGWSLVFSRSYVLTYFSWTQTCLCICPWPYNSSGSQIPHL